MQLIFISGSLRRSSLQVAFLAGSRNTFTQTFVLFPNIDSSLGGLSFGKDGDGNCGYYGADGSQIPFKRITSVTVETWTLTSNGIYCKIMFYYNDNSVKVVFDGVLKTNSSLTYSP